jgi:DNA-binding NtrC family response regulator
MPIELQPKLLRVLNDLKYRPLGGTRERKATARVVAATNVDLQDAIARGTFRQDLFFRLSVLEVRIPPLRERLEDIPLLAWHFARKFATSEGRSSIDLHPEALAALQTWHWPGNVRELSNVIQRAVVLSSGPVVGPAVLGFGARPLVAPPHPPEPPPTATWDELPFTEAKAAATQAFCHAYLVRRLAEAGGNVTLAARAAGLQRPNFKREMRKYGVTSSSDLDPSELDPDE